MKKALLGYAFLALATTTPLWCQKKTAHVVDSGSFSIYLNGTKVGSEQFRIEQGALSSTTHSEVTVEASGGGRAVQSSDLELTSAGNLMHYRWREESPEKVQATIDPSNEFLVQHTTFNPNEKPREQPFLLPASTQIMDDYFFVHREILAWRFLATMCEPVTGGLRCKNQASSFGVLVPRQHLPVTVEVEYKGLESLNIRGAMREWNHFTFTSEGNAWQVWLDRENKLMRILVDANTEVLRD